MRNSENKYTNEDLKTMQSWSLERKIQVTQTRIIEWYEYWKGKVYVSFSGGKDSTVLLDLARRIYPDIEAVFVDTGLEYPEIRNFVKEKTNVTWLHPVKYNKENKTWERTNFKDVIETYGYPIISKDVSDAIYNARRKPDGCRSQRFNSESEYCKKYGKRFDLTKWKFLLESDIPISHMCCDVMKKHPVKNYEKEKCIHPIIGTMACESELRKTSWKISGCNAFNSKRPTSQPMSFWTEQDVLEYIQRFNIAYASVYGDIIEVKGKYKTTGVDRTGCMFCCYGIQCSKSPNKFEQMKITHPKQYDYCINKLEIGKILDFIGVKY